MYYQIDNGDTTVTCDKSGVIDLLSGEAESWTEKTNEEDKPEWTIKLIWMTEDEYDNLPDAY